MITPNMILTLPEVSTTPGPTWASQLNAALELVDAHDHTTGHGALVPTAGLNIDADLSFAAHSATDLFATIYIDQLGVTPSFASGLYVSQNDLWFKNGYGTAVQLTSGASIVGAGGTISGLPSLIAPTAGVAFDGSTGTFTFKKATTEAAILDVGPVTLRRTSAGSNGVTVTPASGTTNYTLTLPAAPPASVASLLGIATTGALSNVAPNSTLTVTSSSISIANLGVTEGYVATDAITTSKIKDGQVTPRKLSAAVQSATASASFTGAITSAQALTSPLNFYTSTNRPLVIMLSADSAGNMASISATGASSYKVYFEVVGPSGTVDVGVVQLSSGTLYTPSAFQAYLVPPPGGGAYTITPYIDRLFFASPLSVAVYNVSLTVYSL